jgi:hypothetical protein
MQDAAALVSMAWLQFAATGCLQIWWNLAMGITGDRANAEISTTGRLLLSGIADAGTMR